MHRLAKNAGILLLFILPCVLCAIWFRNGFVEGGGEEGLAFYDLTRTLSLTKTMWWNYNGGFPTLAWLPKLPFAYVANFLYQDLHLPNFLIQALSYLLIMLTGCFSVYFLTYALCGKYEKGGGGSFHCFTFLLT